MARSLTPRFPKAWRITATIRPAPGHDHNGDPLPAAEPVTVPDCLFARGSSTEAPAHSGPSASKGTLLAPIGTQIASTDRVSLPGLGSWDVDGEPSVWPHGVAISLTRGAPQR